VHGRDRGMQKTMIGGERTFEARCNPSRQ
jgi:hypothetical protein